MRGNGIVLVAARGEKLRKSLGTALRRRRYTVIAVADGFEAEQYLSHSVPDLTVVEMLLPGRSGFQISRMVKERTDGKTAVVMLAENAAEAHCSYAYALGVDQVLVRSLNSADLVDAVLSHCSPPRPVSSSRPGSSSRVA